jgi:hypothetical protein
MFIMKIIFGEIYHFIDSTGTIFPVIVMANITIMILMDCQRQRFRLAKFRYKAVSAEERRSSPTILQGRPKPVTINEKMINEKKTFQLDLINSLKERTKKPAWRRFVPHRTADLLQKSRPFSSGTGGQFHQNNQLTINTIITTSQKRRKYHEGDEER